MRFLRVPKYLSGIELPVGSYVPSIRRVLKHIQLINQHIVAMASIYGKKKVNGRLEVQTITYRVAHNLK